MLNTLINIEPFVDYTLFLSQWAGCAQPPSCINFFTLGLPMVFGTLIDVSDRRLIKLKSISSRIFIGIWLLVAIVIETGLEFFFNRHDRL